jgi:hypothetical protein
MGPKVFICYRRKDSAGHAGRVHDRLERDFGRDLLFMDVDAIPLGKDFVKVLHDEVAKCDVLLAVIGPNWLDARDDDGGRCLDDQNDFVRIEIGAALQRDIPVVPILLDDARIPRVHELPKDLEVLPRRNALHVRHASFHADMDKLVRWLRDELNQTDVASPPVETRDKGPTLEVNTTIPDVLGSKVVSQSLAQEIAAIAFRHKVEVGAVEFRPKQLRFVDFRGKNSDLIACAEEVNKLDGVSSAQISWPTFRGRPVTRSS